MILFNVPELRGENSTKVYVLKAEFLICLSLFMDKWVDMGITFGY